MESNLKKAWEAIVEHDRKVSEGLSTHGKARFRATIGLVVGADKRTIDGWFDDPSILYRKKPHDPVIEGVFSAYKAIARYTSPEWRLAAAVSDKLGLESEDFRSLRNYEGSYHFVRMGRTETVRGIVEILNDSGAQPWYHKHTSTQTIGSNSAVEDVEFTHFGPIFPMANATIYFLGAGSTEKDVYFRPMIIRGHARPHTNILKGVVMTETWEDQKPFAQPCALISTAHPQVNQDGFIEDIAKSLGIFGDRIETD